MLSALIPSGHSYPAVLLAEQPVHQRSVQPGPLVLRPAPLKSPAPTADTIRTVSRRSKPSSRTALMGEQPNPWDILQPQDATSRHRGAKPCRRCDALQSLAAQTIPLSLSRQWRVMEAVDLTPRGPGTSISRSARSRYRGSLYSMLGTARFQTQLAGTRAFLATSNLPSVLPTDHGPSRASPI